MHPNPKEWNERYTEQLVASKKQTFVGQDPDGVVGQDPDVVMGQNPDEIERPHASDSSKWAAQQAADQQAVDDAIAAQQMEEVLYYNEHSHGDQFDLGNVIHDWLGD